MRLPSRKLLCAAGLGLALLAAACSPGSRGPSTRERAAAEGILILGNEGEAPSLDPHLNTSVNGSRVIAALIEGLIAYHPTDDTEPEPGVAASWTHQDYRVWTFHLRPDARWSNGDPVTAQDFLYSTQRILTPQLGANYAEMLFLIKNARAFSAGEITDFSQVGIAAIDERTLRYELIGPTPYFLNLLKHHAWHPVHPPTIEAAGGMAKPDSNWTRQNYVGNGPFTLQEWTLNKHVRAVKNPLYWDAPKVRLNEVRFLPIDDISSADQAFNAGDNHYASVVPSPMIPIYKRDADPYLRLEPYFATYFYKINTTSPPFNDKRVRQAFSMAINRRALVKRIMKGDQAIALSVTPPGLHGYQPPRADDFNPKRARELLAEAGFPGGQGFPRLTILFNTSEQHKAISEALGEMWKNVLGIQVELRNQEWKTFLESQTHLDYQISRSGWIGDYPYPDTFLTLFRSTDGNNNTGWANPQYDALIAESFAEANATRRLELLRQAESILVEELPILPLFYYNRIYRIDPAVKGWAPLFLDNRNYKYLHF